MGDALLTHVLERIAAAPLRSEPFAHLYFERVFPEDFYDALLRHLPDPTLYEPLFHKDALRPDGSTTRSTFTLDEASIARLPEASRETLRRCAAAFASDDLRDAILGRYASVMQQRFGSAGVPPLEATVKLQRDLPGYRIGVHPDTTDKVVLIQLYLPATDAHRHMGTSLYVQRGEGFELVATLPFARNSGFSFAKTADSWHGVEPVIDAERHSLTLNYRLRDQKLRRTLHKRVVRQLRRLGRRFRGVPGAS
jgi:hypothetical protein